MSSDTKLSQFSNTTTAPENATLKRLNRLSNIMDRSITLPGGYKVGWDGIIGLVPGVGDVLGAGVSLYIVFGASRLGASKTTIIRMLGNIGIEALVGSIPLLGDIFDLAFKANSRNMKILDTQLQSPTTASTHNSRWLLVSVLLFTALVFSTVYLIVWLFSAIFKFIF